MAIIFLFYSLLLDISSLSALPPHLPTKLHNVMTKDELIRYLDADSTTKVPEYEVIQIPSLHKRTLHTKKTHKLSFLGKSLSLQVKSSNGIHSGLVVERRRVGGFTEKDLYKPRGQFYHGHVMSEPGSIVALQSNAEGSRMSGTIVSRGHLYRIQPMTSEIRERGSLQGDGYHIVSRRSLKRTSKQPPVRVSGLGGKMAKLGKRAPSKVVEYMITLDQVTSEYYNSSAMDYVLNLANMVNRLYSDPSMGFDVTTKLVKVFIIQQNEPALDFALQNIRSAATYLHRFREWARKHNAPAAAPEHYDNAVLVSRQVCGLVDCSLDGLAYYDAPCSFYGVNVNNDRGLQTAFSIAHEMGHNLGADHDYGDCRGHIMNAGQNSGPTAFTWSACSSKALQRRFGRVTCYDNEPPVQLELPSRPPGYNINADKQCELLYGAGYTICPLTQTSCDRLFCYRGSSCVSQGSPPADGTSCGWRKWCMKGHCVKVGTSLPPPVHGLWSRWGAYSACSRTCGGGVRHRIRKCNNPSPQFGGKDCTGSHQGEWQVCKQLRCKSGDYRREQCVQRGFQSDYYTVKTPCALYCRRGNMAESCGTMADGTRCSRDPDVLDVCIQGKCRHVGCDHVLETGNPVDRCGKCGMDGSACVPVQEFYTDKTHKAYGPNAAAVMFKIPVNATTISVVELAKTNNFMSLKLDPPENNAFLIPVPSWSRTLLAAGTKIEYHMKRIVDAEKIFIKGPTNALLNVMYIYVGYYDNPGFKLTYYIPGQTTTNAFVWKVERGIACSRPCAGGEQTNKVTCHRADDGTLVGPQFCDQNSKPHGSAACNTQPCKPRWSVGEWGVCSRTCASGQRTRSLKCLQSITQSFEKKLDSSACNQTQPPAVTTPCNVVDCSAEWVTGPWTQCSVECGGGSQTRQMVCQHTLSNSSAVDLPSQKCREETGMTPTVTQSCNNFSCYEWKVEYPCRNCSAYYHKGCYGDRKTRVLPVLLRAHLAANAVDECYQLAQHHGYEIFAVQNGGECWSGGTAAKYDMYGHSSSCRRGRGGEWANDVYFIVPQKSYKPIGCFNDNRKGKERPLPTMIGNHRNDIDWTNMHKTIMECLQDAWGDGLPVFGVQYYGECWSGRLGHESYNVEGPSMHGCWRGVGGSHANYVYIFTSKVVEPEISCRYMATNTAVSHDKCNSSAKPAYKLKLCEEICNQ